VTGFLDRAPASHHDEAAGKGEVGRKRFNWEGVDGALFDAAVAGVGV
jgi:hypothetical protein